MCKMNDKRERVTSVNHTFLREQKDLTCGESRFATIAYTLVPPTTQGQLKYSIFLHTSRDSLSLLDEKGSPDLSEFVVSLWDACDSGWTHDSSTTIGIASKLFGMESWHSELLEKNIADIVSTEIVRILSEGITTIFVCGPFLPKLIGRLGYKHLSRDFSLFGINVTSNMFATTIGSTTLSRLRDNINGIKELCRDEYSREVYYLLEDNHNQPLTKTLKHWNVVSRSSAGRFSKVFEIVVICQFSGTSLSGNSIWEEKLDGLCKCFDDIAQCYVDGKHIWLPASVAYTVDSLFAYVSHHFAFPRVDVREGSRYPISIVDVFNRTVFHHYEDLSIPPRETLRRRALLISAESDKDLMQKFSARARSIYHEIKKIQLQTLAKRSEADTLAGDARERLQPHVLLENLLKDCETSDDLSCSKVWNKFFAS